MTRFALPDLGEGLQEAEIVDWHIAAGDHVVADQPLVSVETEKAVVEIPSPVAGRVLRLLARIGDRVQVGAPLVEFEEGPHPDAGTVVGELAERIASAPTAAPAQPAARAPIVKAAPAARALAAEHGIDIRSIRGSGAGGLITHDDVLRAMAQAGTSPSLEPLRGVRLSMARNMAAAGRSVVPATLFDDADVTAWWGPHADVTLRLIRAIVAGCKAEPALNCWFDEAALTREPKPRVDLGIAVDTTAGLIVPVLRDVGGRDRTLLRQSLDALKASVRARTVASAELKGATITLSNFGAIGGRHATLVVLPPQVAIIGAGRISSLSMTAAPGSHAHWLPLSLTFDHRVVTGGEAARFAKAMIEDLEQPA